MRKEDAIIVRMARPLSELVETRGFLEESRTTGRN